MRGCSRIYGAFVYVRRFSPHVRGCSEGQGSCRGLRRLFPEHAGLFLRSDRSQNTRSFPRTRGVVPPKRLHLRFPLTRGCSAGVCYGDLARIFPAFRRWEDFKREHPEGADNTNTPPRTLPWRGVCLLRRVYWSSPGPYTANSGDSPRPRFHTARPDPRWR